MNMNYTYIDETNPKQPKEGCAGYIYEIIILETEVESIASKYLGSHYSSIENVYFDKRIYETSTKNEQLQYILQHPSTKYEVRLKEWYEESSFVPVRESVLLRQIGDNGAKADSNYFNDNDGILSSEQEKLKFDHNRCKLFAQYLKSDKHDTLEEYFGNRKVSELKQNLGDGLRIQTRPIELEKNIREIAIGMKKDGKKYIERIIILLDYEDPKTGQTYDAILDGSTTIWASDYTLISETGSIQKVGIKDLDTIELPPYFYNWASLSELKQVGIDCNPNKQNENFHLVNKN